MSLKFVDSLSTAQHKQFLVFSSYIIIFSNVSEINVKNDEDTPSDMSFTTVLL